MGSITAHPAEEMRGEPWDARRAAQSRAFYLFVTAAGLKIGAGIPDQYGMMSVI